ncbi:TPA: fibrinogen-binding protein [Staphylococcus aureus]|nr:fibrinogen-binding protein [Staphylococcus aureus]HDN3492065.1 fibrinogen-binding protein [Staphylococcus aureus]HDZ8756023.1 fibrinogen-binding protein [Staphylococcus aureus]HEK6547122.1 fibrinogen-binding protein [Staphylococcus aureus]
MTNKLTVKALLAIAAVGVTTTTLASGVDAAGYGPREKKPVAIKNNIVEYSDGTFKYQSRPKFNKTPKYIKFRHANNNIVEYSDGTFEYGPRPESKKPQIKKPVVKPQGKTLAEGRAFREARLAKAKIAVAEFDQNRNVKTHRAAQRAVNLILLDDKQDQKLLQNRIDDILKKGLLG